MIDLNHRECRTSAVEKIGDPLYGRQQRFRQYNTGTPTVTC